MSDISGDAGVTDQLKLVVVGDGAVGKTCLLISYVNKTFPKEYTPTIFDNFAVNVTVDTKIYNVTLWDTAGQEEYDRLRPLSYPGTDVFLLCFSVVDTHSYQNVRFRWIPEVTHQCPTAKYFLVGLKIDLRTDPATVKQMELAGQRPYTREDGEKLASELGAMGYFECSALLQQNINETFEGVIRMLKGGAAPGPAGAPGAPGAGSTGEGKPVAESGVNDAPNGENGEKRGKKKKLNCLLL